MVMINKPLNNNNHQPSIIAEHLRSATNTSRFGESYLCESGNHIIPSVGDPFVELAIANIINPSTNNPDDTDPGGQTFSNFIIDPGEKQLYLSDSERKKHKASQKGGLLSKISNHILLEGAPFSSPYFKDSYPNQQGIGNFDGLFRSIIGLDRSDAIQVLRQSLGRGDISERATQALNTESIEDIRKFLEKRRTGLLLRNKLFFMGDSSSGKSSLADHFEIISQQLFSNNLVLKTANTSEAPLFKKKETTTFDATTSKRFMQSLLNLTLRSNQLVLVELPGTLATNDIPNNVIQNLSRSIRGNLRIPLMANRKINQRLGYLKPEGVLFSTVHLDAIESNPEAAQGIVAPITQNDKSKHELLDKFLSNVDISSQSSNNGTLNTNLLETQSYLNHNLRQIFDLLPNTLKGIFAFGVINNQVVMPVLLPLNQQIKTITNSVGSENLEELHKILILIDSQRKSENIDKSRLANVIGEQYFDIKALARHAIDLCPEYNALAEKLIDIYNFAENLSSIGLESRANTMAQTLYHTIVALVGLGHQTNAIDYDTPLFPDAY